MDILGCLSSHQQTWRWELTASEVWSLYMRWTTLYGADYSAVKDAVGEVRHYPHIETLMQNALWRPIMRDLMKYPAIPNDEALDLCAGWASGPLSQASHYIVHTHFLTQPDLHL